MDKVDPALSGVISGVVGACGSWLPLLAQCLVENVEVVSVAFWSDHLVHVRQWADLDLKPGLLKGLPDGARGPRFGPVYSAAGCPPLKAQIAIALYEENRIFPCDDGTGANAMAHAV